MKTQAIDKPSQFSSDSDLRLIDSIEEYRLDCRRALLRQSNASGWERGRISFLGRQIDDHARGLRKIVRLSAEGRLLEANRKTALTLQAFGCRLCGILDQIVSRKGAAEPLPKMSWNRFEKLVQASPLAGQPPDPCTVMFQKKANGKKRVITSPGLKTRAAQRPLAIVLEANGISNPFEHNGEGKGVTAALTSIKRAIIDDGLRWFVIFDLANYFTSVKPDHLRWAPIPTEIMQNVVYFNQHATLIQGHKPHRRMLIGRKCHPARLGIPQGAVISGILTSALLGRELRNLSEDLGIVTYVDDGVIGARSQPEAEKAARALEKQFANLKGGPIHFKYIEVRDACQGFPFLGYWVQRLEVDGQVRVRFTPRLRTY